MSKDTMLRAMRLPEALRSIASAVVVLVLIVGGFWGSHFFETAHSDSDSHTESATPDSTAAKEIALSRTKDQAAGIQLCQVKYADVQRTKTVAGTIDYDFTRHLSIKAPVECVVERWLVQPGQMVPEDASLAVLSGAAVALARTEIGKCKADVRIAQISFDWSKETQANLTELLAALEQQPAVEKIQAEFGAKRLGEHRDHLLTNYARYVLANNVATRSKPLGDQGIIPGRTAESRIGERNVAETNFKSACEQSEFEGRQRLAKAHAELDLAQQKLAVAEDRLRLLLGRLAHKSTSGKPGDFELRAPFSGRVEALHASHASRLAQGEPVLTLADTTKLWVSAFIHQQDWEALRVALKRNVRLTLPAMPDEALNATVSFVGPEVSPDTRAISLIGELDNPDGRLRPGMFAWVELPIESPRKALVVPPSAIQRHESETFVFVPVGENRYRRVAVLIGMETPDYVEIEHGLSAGQQVVDRGAFHLKSEFLLEQEEE